MSPISTRSLYLSLSVIILLLIASIIITNQFAQSRTIKRTVEPPLVVVQETRLIADSLDKETAIYVSTKGTSSGDGSQERPLDLNTVLTRQVRPGTTIWIRGGVYVGSFMSYLTGTASKAITVSGFSGERATIDGSLTIYGSFTTFSNLEVTNSSLNRNVPRATGVDVYGPGTKLINNMIHDTGNGIGLWSQALNAEVYGNIIFNCGMNVSGYAHGIYVQNAQGSKLIKDNIIFNNFGYGIHAYGERGSIKNIRFEGNISFNNGVLNAERHFEPNIFVGGSTPAEDISIVQNFTYQGSPGISRSANVQLYYRSHENKNLVLTDNYIVGGNFEVQWWQSLDVTGNTVFGNGRRLFTFGLAPRADKAKLRWDNNTYYYLGGDVPIAIEDGGAGSFNQWQAATGFDRNSRYFTSGPTTPQVFLRPNAYEQGRANIVVYNWDQRELVEVDVSALLRPGDRYEVRDVQDYWKGALFESVYDGRPLRLPMKGLSVVKPVGGNTPSHTGPGFNAFLLIRRPH